MSKGEIAQDEQYLLLPQCFQKSSAAELSESVFMWERVNLAVIDLTMSPERQILHQTFTLSHMRTQLNAFGLDDF